MSEINFCNTKEQLNHLGEVVTGKVDGSPSGADIETSTLSYTGQVRKTLPALEAEAESTIASYKLKDLGPYASGILIPDSFSFVQYGGKDWFAISTPHTTTTTTPDNDSNMKVGSFATMAYVDSRYTSVDERVDELNSSESNKGASLVRLDSGITVQQFVDGQSNPEWFLRGDGIAPDVVYDMNVTGGYSGNGSSVDSINSIGKISGALLPSATAAEISNIYGFYSAEFSSGVDKYSGMSTWAQGFLSSEKSHFAASCYIPSNIAGSSQVRIGAGTDGTGNGWRNEDSSNAISRAWVSNPLTSSKVTYTQGPLAFSDGEIQTNAVYHNGVDSVSQWSNGVVIALNKTETAIAAQPDLDADELTIGAASNDTLSLSGNFIAGCIDNNSSLGIDNAYSKYRYLFSKYQGSRVRDADVIRCVGQSNAGGDFANPNPFSFGQDEAYYLQKSGSPEGSQGIYKRDGFTQGLNDIGASNFGVWFCDEWKKLTKRTPLYQVIAASGQPITPAISGKSLYWAPKNSVGDSAGQNSLNEVWRNDFERFSSLRDYSPEFSVRNDIALIFEGEADAVAYTAGDPAITTQAALEGLMHAWLDLMKSRLGVNVFAVVNIGRSGATESAVQNNSEGVSFVRDAWVNVIESRSDTYDIFPHLNHVPSPFVLDDLITDSDGAWISGQANLSDGIHYTPEMYEAIARTGARNLFSSI